MKLRTPASRAAFAAVATTLAVTLGASTALAASATTLSAMVTKGGAFTASSSTVTLTDAGVSLTCSSSGSTPALTATGSIPSGTKQGASPLKVGTSKTFSLSGCNGPLGPVTATFSKLPYSIKADSATNASGQTDEIISGIDATVSMTGCSFTTTGSIPGYYTNSTGNLTLTPTLPMKPLNKAQLTVSNVSGCAGLVNNGDHPALSSIVIVIIIVGPRTVIVIVIIINARNIGRHETLAHSLR